MLGVDLNFVRVIKRAAAGIVRLRSRGCSGQGKRKILGLIVAGHGRGKGLRGRIGSFTERLLPSGGLREGHGTWFSGDVV